ncbi:MAG TPA: phosphoribosylamine--glycine ligase [Acidiferrobacter sp.]|nr:phosphoribosylamine--glycine ligase [Acidiferrobacter sp.]
MKILIVGSGGREHALAWKIAQSPLVQAVLVAPGNAGTAREPKTRNLPISTEDLDGLVAAAEAEDVALTIVGPEAPLVAGIVDRFTAAGLACLGPTAAAAQLEGSKSYAKAFLARHGIPTARYEGFTDLQAARRYLEDHPGPQVVKADGLAAGKGVVVAEDSAAALAAATMMLAGAFGAASAKIVIEERLVGIEASFIVLVDGLRYVAFPTSEDHKRRDDGDRGPNTGGMGAFSPASAVDEPLLQTIQTTIIEPTLRGLVADGHHYRGFLYAGLMITSDGPKVLEFNCRFGDPETQPIMMRMTSDLVPLVQAAFAGTLSADLAAFDARPALCVVLAAPGYPGTVREGYELTGLDQDDGETKIFHGGTRSEGGHVLSAGGRVLGVTSLGVDMQTARARAYARIETIGFPGAVYRHDIGQRFQNRRP